MTIISKVRFYLSLFQKFQNVGEGLRLRGLRPRGVKALGVLGDNKFICAVATSRFLLNNSVSL